MKNHGTRRATVVDHARRLGQSAALLGDRFIAHTNIPLVVLGDFNDTPDSVTTQPVYATNEIAYDRSARDVALFNAYALQEDGNLKKDVAYSHIHQRAPSVLGQTPVSEEFNATGRNSIGDVARSIISTITHIEDGTAHFPTMAQCVRWCVSNISTPPPCLLIYPCRQHPDRLTVRPLTAVCNGMYADKCM